MYNRINFRDLNKSKKITRKQYVKINDNVYINKNYLEYTTKKDVKAYHKYTSEVEKYTGYANQAHHIFMKSDFPELACTRENIITLTPNQHFNQAHKNNNTNIIDEKYQHICLISKLESIRRSLNKNDDFYSIDRYKYVVNTGKPQAKLTDTDSTNDIVKKLSLVYSL